MGPLYTIVRYITPKSVSLSMICLLWTSTFNENGVSWYVTSSRSQFTWYVRIYDARDHKLVKYKPDLVINCAGAVKQKIGKNFDEKNTFYINSIFPHELYKISSKIKSRLIHFSTDCVFDGKKGNYNEHFLPNSTDLYGLSKILGEVSYKNSLTLRTSIIGHELLTNLSLIDWFLSQEKNIKGYSNAIFSGLPCCYVAEILIKYVFNSNLKGLFHLSVQPISKFDLLKKVSLVYGKRISIKEDEDYHSNKSLDSSQFSKLTGYKPLEWNRLINRMYKDYRKFYNG